MSIKPDPPRLPLRKKGTAMMTKEEVAQVIAYCEENKVGLHDNLLCKGFTNNINYLPSCGKTQLILVNHYQY